MSRVTVTEERVYVTFDSPLAAAQAAATAVAAADRAEAATPGFIAVEGHELYDPAYSYDKNNVVVDSGVRYYSLINGNLGNAPATSPEAWKAYDFGSEYNYSEALTLNLPSDGGFGGDGTKGVALQIEGVDAGFLGWSASYPWRLYSAAGADIGKISSAGLLEIPAISVAGPLTTAGVVTAAASGQPLVVNSTNSAFNKITLQDNGTTRGRIGADANNCFAAASLSGPALQVGNVADAVNWLQVQPGATGVTVRLSASSVTDTNVGIRVRSQGSGDARLGTSADELRVSATAIQGQVPFLPPAYTVATAPTPTAGHTIRVTDDVIGSPCLAMADGTVFRRAYDNAPISTT